MNKTLTALSVLLIHATPSHSYAACLPSTEATCDDTPIVDAREWVATYGDTTRWRPELEFSYLAGDQNNSLVYLTARLARLRNSFSFAGVEATATFAKADLSSSEEFVHVQGTLSGLFGLSASSSATYDLRAAIALGIVFGGAQEVDGDDFGYTEGAIGFKLEPRAVLEIKSVVSRLTPIVSLGYLQTVVSHSEFGSFRLGIGLAF